MRACTYVHGNESILRSLPSRLAEVVKDIRYSRANRSNNVSVPRISRVPVRFFLFFFIKQEKMSISPGDVGLICGGRRCALQIIIESNEGRPRNHPSTITHAIYIYREIYIYTCICDIYYTDIAPLLQK